MTVYTCSPDLASILTCIYEAWNSRLGYRNVRLMTEPVGNLELFCDYCHVEPDTEKAASVTRSIQKKIGAAAWRLGERGWKRRRILCGCGCGYC